MNTDRQIFRQHGKKNNMHDSLDVEIIVTFSYDARVKLNLAKFIDVSISTSCLHSIIRAYAHTYLHT